MQSLGKIFLLIVVLCYVSTIYAKSDNVAEEETNIDGVKTGADAGEDTSDTAAGAEKTQDVNEHAADTLSVVKEKVVEIAKVGTEYVEAINEKVATAAETSNEYLTKGAYIVKGYATEYADEAIKHGKIFSEVAKETLEDVATATVKSAKEFASEAYKVTSEYASHAGQIIQEKVPVAIEVGKEFAAKAVELGQEYGKDALKKTGEVYEAGKEKAEELIKSAKKKLDL